MRWLLFLLLGLAACTDRLSEAERRYAQAVTPRQKCEAAQQAYDAALDAPELRRAYWRSNVGYECLKADVLEAK